MDSGSELCMHMCMRGFHWQCHVVETKSHGQKVGGFHTNETKPEQPNKLVGDRAKHMWGGVA